MRYSLAMMTPTSPSIKEIDALLSGATPQFSQQLKARLYALVSELPADDPVRRYGEVQMQMLDRLARGTTRSTSGIAEPPATDASWDTLPSHPRSQADRPLGPRGNALGARR